MAGRYSYGRKGQQVKTGCGLEPSAGAGKRIQGRERCSAPSWPSGRHRRTGPNPKCL